MLLAEGSGVTSRLLAVCDSHGLVGGRRLGMLFAEGSGVTSRLLAGCDGGAYGTVVVVVNMRAAVGQNCRYFRFLTTYFDLESCVFLCFRNFFESKKNIYKVAHCLILGLFL